MFRHIGKTRTFSHNLRIASLLSFVAGLVNVAGFLAVARLTTNVTGHFAFLVEEVFRLEWIRAFVFFLYIFSFFLGSFVSNIMVEAVSRINEKYIYSFPVILEIGILAGIALWGESITHPDMVACSLLFSMGLQNSLVTTISNSVVRTTHLTGLFTDLGIEFSQLFFYKGVEEKSKLLSSIRLRLTIISFFFIGGIAGGIFYVSIGMKAFLVTAVVLIAGLVYDTVKFRLISLKRKLNILP